MTMAFDNQSLFDQAVDALRGGDPKRGKALLEQALSANPRDTKLWLTPDKVPRRIWDLVNTMPTDEPDNSRSPNSNIDFTSNELTESDVEAMVTKEDDSADRATPPSGSDFSEDDVTKPTGDTNHVLDNSTAQLPSTEYRRDIDENEPKVER